MNRKEKYAHPKKRGGKVTRGAEETFELPSLETEVSTHGRLCSRVLISVSRDGSYT